MTTDLDRDLAITEARTRKARALADVLAAAGFTADLVEAAPFELWELAAQTAGCRMPSPATIAIVRTIIEERER